MATTSPTFVFVHGAFLNSFCWSAVQRELALLGHRSLAVDLPGHGFGAAYSRAYQAPQDRDAMATAPSALAGVTLADNVEHVGTVVRRAAAHGPVILVGHSRGGLTVTGVGNAIPDLVHRMVYVSAWCSVDGLPPDYGTAPEFATTKMNADCTELVGDAGTLGATRLNPRSADPSMLTSLKAAILQDGTDAQFLTLLNLMEQDESLDTGTADDLPQAGTWGTVPRTYVRLTSDQGVPPIALQDRFIAEADALTPDNQFDVRSIESSHLGFLLDGTELAAVLADLADA